VPIAAIAERQDISANYLEQVFALLRKGGLVKSVKGAQGGYILTDRPSNLTVGRILRALEGDLSITNNEDAVNIANNPAEYCLKSAVWDKLNDCINQLADAITLEDLLQQYKTLNTNLSLGSYI